MLFVSLKLTGSVDWSWWWVLSPLGIMLLVVAVFMLFAVFAAAVMAKE